ncbi:unnamed protein product [Cyprideis torosa]|uniref:NADP-dependent oxidoreductase domain-containing protein n=1 Tax=Cyprideis torosa TaxID=163714 RepID=A0A7R8ZMP4_9CRUS|nr:unnamed protein product [Cyprideis torosa]CAG0884879.1 unnamed protein product [Cyprideis torosa]
MSSVLPEGSLPPTYVDGFHDLDAVKRMTYTRVGDTDMYFSKLGFGGAVAGGIYGDFETEEIVETIVDAVRQGINWIDTAAFYGWGRSEEIIGLALKRMPRQAYYISTKCCRYGRLSDKKSIFNFSYERVMKSIDESLEKLGIAYVDLYVIHDIEFAPSLDIVTRGALRAIKDVQKAGKTKLVGVSALPVRILAEMVQRSIAAGMKIDFVLSYTRNVLFDTTLQEYLPAFEKQGVIVLNASPLANGLLTSGVNIQEWHCANLVPGLKKAAEEADAYCQSKGIDISRLAISFCVSTPGIPSHLNGIHSKEALQKNLDAVLNPLSAEEKEVLQHIRKEYVPLKLLLDQLSYSYHMEALKELNFRLTNGEQEEQVQDRICFEVEQPSIILTVFTEAGWRDLIPKIFQGHGRTGC